MPERITGKIKWFNKKKGYGFIIPDDGSSDVFLHCSAISGEGFATIKEGMKVEFHIVQKQKGIQAVEVTKVK